MTNHVLDWRRDYGSPRGKVLRRFCWAYKTRRVVQCKRHDRHVPPGEMGGKVRIGDLANVVDIGGTRQITSGDFHNWPNQDNRPFRSSRRRRRDQRQIQAFVDNPIVTQGRTAHGCRASRLRTSAAGNAKVLDVNARRKRMDVIVEKPLCFEQTVSTCEYDICPSYQFSFQ